MKDCASREPMENTDHPPIDKESQLIAHLNDQRVPTVVKEFPKCLEISRRDRDFEIRLDLPENEIVQDIHDGIAEERYKCQGNDPASVPDHPYDQYRLYDQNQNAHRRTEVKSQVCGYGTDEGTSGKTNREPNPHD
jgi:hypothetical protein